MDMIEKLSLVGIVPVIKVEDAADAVPLCKALSDGGLPVAEITFRSDAAEEAIRRVHAALPEVILGLSLLLLFVAAGMARGFWTVLAAHTTLTLCYATVVVQARLVSFDGSLEEAAQDLGCPPWEAFLRITLPIIAPAVGAAWMLAFTLSLDDLVIASFASGPGATTLPMRIYSQVRLGVSPEINAISTLLIGAVATGAVIFDLARRRRARIAR